MSNGPKLTMAQGLQLTPAIGLQMAPLITPTLRRSRAQRPTVVDADETPWRDRAARGDRASVPLGRGRR